MIDKGGWRSKGTCMKCPKCGEDGALIETTIHGKTTTSHFCNVCGHDWLGTRTPDTLDTGVAGELIDGP